MARPGVLFLRMVLFPVGAAVIYLLFAVLLAVIPVNRDFSPEEEGVEIFVSTNGIHVFFLFPVKNAVLDWERYLDRCDFPGVGVEQTYISIGWGDRRFYLETPEWSDLRWTTALKAVFWPTPAAMHITFSRAPLEGPDCLPIILSSDQYRQLTQYVLNTFQMDTTGMPVLLPQHGYTAYDRFYEAGGRYTLFKTCNDWINRGLKEVGIRCPAWSPFDKGIIFQLRQVVGRKNDQVMPVPSQIGDTIE